MKKKLGFRSESFDFLKSYLNNYSPSGHEASGQQIWLDYVRPYSDAIITDVYGTAVAVVNPDAKYKVVIEAHADEIAWVVSGIDDNGYISIKMIGYPDVQTAPAKRVNIFAKSGIVKGVIGWPAIHTRKDDNELKTELKNLYIDIGASSKEEVEKLGIHIGTVAAFDDYMTTLNDNFIVGRGLDNKMGGFVIAEVLRKIRKNNIKLPYGLYVVNAVQEEIGLRGAEMIARRIKPDVAICTDVCHDTQSPMYDKAKDGDFKCGNGPVITYAPAVQKNLREMLISVADSNKIKFQRDIGNFYTGTDTDAFAYSNKGVASALISLPLKYMHTTVETVHKDDVKNVINLMYNFLLQLNADHDFREIK
jgi:putative aminopeptidase FrvX